ncbi:MAG: tetratricopeptide repeat protein [Verrucomicrobiae bacterium]|nr:tetratricopeptide repeat protein [Verrucomicrobiae bacterium]NNJ43177.1 tetratricopeptide repeat protein [Akkermansiaceae bacterium]
MRKKAFLQLALGGISLSLLASCGPQSGALPISSGSSAPIGVTAANTELGQARAYQSAGKTRKAVSAYKDIIKSYPYTDASGEARFSLARLYDQEGNLLKAFEAYQGLISQHPGSHRYATAIQRQETVAHSAANGIIKNNFLGMKTRISPEKTEKMLIQVRENAPRAVSASKAQFAIGRIWQQEGYAEKSIAAYQKISTDYATSSHAPESLYQTGQILILKSERGNQNKANVNRARHIFTDLIQRFPMHRRAADARKRLAMLSGQDIQRSYDTAEFYQKKGKTQSAIFYYREVLRMSKSGALHNQAKQRITELGG